MRVALKRAFAGLVVISASNFSLCAVASSSKMSVSANDLSSVADVSLVPVKNGAIGGASFKAEELWKELPSDDALIIHVVRRPG